MQPWEDSYCAYLSAVTKPALGWSSHSPPASPRPWCHQFMIPKCSSPSRPWPCSIFNVSRPPESVIKAPAPPAVSPGCSEGWRSQTTGSCPPKPTPADPRMLPVHLAPFLPLGASHPKGRAKERQFGCLMLKDKWEKRSQGFTAYCGLSLGIPSLSF